MWSARNTYRVILILIVFQINCVWSLSDKRLCADPKCQEIISLGKAKVTYTANEKGRISFKINSPIRVRSKSAGSDPSLWGIEVNGRLGYAPKEFIKEERILVKEKDVKFEVPVVVLQDVAQHAIDVPSVKLNPSEVITEEKGKPTAAPQTVPLESATEATPSTLNASESEEETTTTTAPLTVEDTKIVNQSLREAVTPVVNSFEMIDGTAIPIIEDTPRDPTNIDTGNESKEHVTTKTDTKSTLSTEQNLETSNEAIPVVKSDNKQIGEDIPKKNEVVDEGNSVLKEEGEADVVVEAEKTQTEQLAETANEAQEKLVIGAEAVQSNQAQSKEQETLNEVDAIEEKSEEEEATSTEQQEHTPVAKLEDTKQNSKQVDEVKNEATTATAPTNQDIKATINDDAIKKSDAEDLPLNKEISNIEAATKVETSQPVSTTPPAVVQQESSSPNIVENEVLADIQSQESLGTNETGTFGDPYLDNEEDDDDEDEDDIDVNENDKENHINTPSESAEAVTPQPLEDFTDSGFATLHNRNYWEEEEEIATTTAPAIAIEETTPAIAKEVEAVETTSTAAVTDSNNIDATTETPDAVEEHVEVIETEAVESTTQKPQVPSIPSTLPLFQQPTLPPRHHQHQHEQRETYENPNDYYREQNLKQQAESKPVENIPSYPAQHNVPEAIPVNTEQYHTASTEHNVNVQSNDESSNTGTASIEEIPSIPTSPSPSPLPEQHTEIPAYMPKEEKPEAGLFTTILGTVNSFVSKLRKEPQRSSQEASDEDDELQHILYPDRISNNKDAQQGEQYCEKLSPHQCPQQQPDQHMSSSANSFENQQCHYDWSHINMDNFVDIFLAKAFEMREFLSCLTIAAAASLLFIFGYYCFCNSSREGALISKLNQLERSLLASHKENAILKDDLLKTRNKLTSIEDNSFGSNDMVIALKKELDVLTAEKHRLQEHVHSLEKELETAAEAGLELNKIVAELLNNQTGQESMIMNSVEDLQMQFNEQQKTILEINANLAEKSRENSELQLMLAEQNVRFDGEIASLQQDNDELESEKANLQTRIEEIKTEFEDDITKALDGKNAEIKRLQNEIIESRNRFEDIHTKWQTSLAKIEALEDCMKTMKKDPGVNMTEVINAVNVKAELLDLQQQRASLKSLLDTEAEARQHAESSLKNTISEVDRLKQDFHQSEKDKLEAQTRLEVLSNYFKEKETQLQKELSLKEAIWLKQQGENTSTVDRMTAMQDEIQSLKSQNDALRAEIEAQIAAHKAQTGTLENRAHETWLSARQSERRYEEARAEAAALRRRLTELAGATNSGELNRATVDNTMSAELTNAPSPIMAPPLLDTAGSPLLGRLPPPQFMPFMGPPPPPFLNLPRPPFLSSLEMRPAPLGRMMSPPLGRYSPPPPPPQRERDRRGYYEDDYDYDDDDDYDAEEDDYDYEEEEDMPRHRRQRRLSGNGSDSWRRDNYSPPPPDRSYRSHSPEDSRYNYTADRDLMSTYETDLSPPPSPPERGGISGGGGSRTGNYAYSPQSSRESTKDVRKFGKGVPNSDSDKSYNSTHKKKGKSMV